MADIGLPGLRARVRSLSDAVRANPGMYFGAYPASDWPLVIAAWTAADLLRLAPAPAPVALTLHRDGSLSATIRGATVVGTHPELADAVKAGMWYVVLARATTVHTGPQVEPDLVAGEYVWRPAELTVRSDLDGALFGLPGGGWWRDGLPRLAAVLATPRHRPPDGRRVHAADEASGTTADLP